MSKPEVGGRYRHTKRRSLYVVEAVGILEATHELAVVYRTGFAGSDKTVWIRTVAEWERPNDDGTERFVYEPFPSPNVSVFGKVLPERKEGA